MNYTNNHTGISNPCKSICVYDRDKICTGCFRTMEEAAKWPTLTDEEKKEVIRNAALRKTQIRTENNLYDHYV